MPKGVKLIPESLSVSSYSSCRGDRVGFTGTRAGWDEGHAWVIHMWAYLSRDPDNSTPSPRTYTVHVPGLGVGEQTELPPLLLALLIAMIECLKDVT